MINKIMTIDGFQDIIDVVKKTWETFQNINKKEDEDTDLFLNESSTQSFISYLNTTYTTEQLQKELWANDIVWYIKKLRKESWEAKIDKVLHMAGEIVWTETKPALHKLKEDIKQNDVVKNISFVGDISKIISGEENNEEHIGSLIGDFIALSNENDRTEFLKSHWMPVKQAEIKKPETKGTASNTDNKEEIENSKDVFENTTKTNTDYMNIVESIIDNIEWWYYHPDMNISRMGKSWETMMGIDRKHWWDLNTSTAWKKFRAIIDEDKKEHPELRKHKYKWGDKEEELKKLAGEIIEPHYKELSEKYLSPEALSLINKDWRLLFNFIYGARNGEWWFKKFAKQINDKIASWETNTDVLYKHIMDFRKHWTWNSLIAQWGKKIEKIIEKQIA